MNAVSGAMCTPPCLSNADCERALSTSCSQMVGVHPLCNLEVGGVRYCGLFCQHPPPARALRGGDEGDDGANSTMATSANQTTRNYNDAVEAEQEQVGAQVADFGSCDTHGLASCVALPRGAVRQLCMYQAL